MSSFAHQLDALSEIPYKRYTAQTDLFNLYVAGKRAAHNQKQLSQHQIKAILTLGRENVSHQTPPANVHSLVIDVSDSVGENLAQHWWVIIEFIDLALQ
jgi:hypothetical protein